MIVLVVAASALLCAGLIVLLKPLLVRYALARPNARSSHAVPTPQGGGIAVVASTLLVAGGALTVWPASFPLLAVAALLLALVGAVDDIYPLPAPPRFLLYVLAVALVVVPGDVRLFPETLPSWLEKSLLVFCGLWFVNLVNFMDGLDWITVAGMLPVAAFVSALGPLGLVPTGTAIVAAALCGALIGFAPFNKPVAKLFLGDVGALPIGLIVGWLLLQLAGAGALAAAILLPLYHLADATITLVGRLARRERVWEPHRGHFYQRATGNGFSPLAVSLHVFSLNLLLAGLAAIALASPSLAVQVAVLAVGAGLVGGLLRRFSAPPRKAH